MPVRPIGALVVAVILFTASDLGAQSGWSWPENPANLQVLPDDMTGQRLRPVMAGFTRALGVRCSYCHVGEEGQPLSTYDFASDANPMKDTAREMLRMLGSINEHLERIESDRPTANVWCDTCHRGTARPLRLTDALIGTWKAEGAAATIEHYHRLRERYYGRGAYDFGEGSLNAVGYALLEDGDVDGAVAVFELNAQMYPDSSNVWDSLAEAQLAAGHVDEAVEFYQKSLDLDPTNRNAAGKLEELRGE